MKKKQGLALSGGLILAGIAIWLVYLLSPIEIQINGAKLLVRSMQLSTGGILADAGIIIRNGDSVYPSLDSPVITDQPIRIRQSSSFNIQIDSQVIPTYSIDRFPPNVLGTLGMRIFPGDELIVDGIQVTPSDSLEVREHHTIQLKRARSIQLNQNLFSTAKPTAREIAWHTNLVQTGSQIINYADQTFIPAGSDLHLSGPVTISVQNSISYTSWGDTVGQTLANLGLAPQGLDISTTDLHQPASQIQVPIELVRVDETLSIDPKSIPFNRQTKLDDTLPLDQQSVTQTGEYGLMMQLTRTRFQDGKEVSKIVESETVLQQPRDEIVGYGSKIDIQSTVVDGIAIEYYRAVSLYATSYSPCRSGGTSCSTGTASGEPARKGIVAVIPGWYAYMSGQQVYIPGYGYGVIGDTGGGIPGTNWIDLGYNDDDYVGWHSWVTVYFLTPVPANLLYVLN